MKLNNLNVLIYSALSLLVFGCNSVSYNPMHELFYTTPAAQWMETLPLGNGRLGMMPDGGVESELIVLNEISMWSGSEADYSNPDAGRSLPKIRQLIFEGRNIEAQALMYEKFIPRNGENSTYGSYQVLANLSLDFFYDKYVDFSDYRRGLRLSDATTYTSYKVGDRSYNRTYFASRDRDLMFVNLKSNVSQSVSFDLKLDRGNSPKAVSLDDGAVMIKGELDSGQKDVEGVKYVAVVDVVVDGKMARRSSNGGVISVRDADQAWIVISAATSFFEGDNYEKSAMESLLGVVAADFDDVHKEAIASFQELYNRAELSIDGDSKVAALPTDERIRAFADQDDPSLAALYYNYGRYLLISSTREGSLPPNLQGLWANENSTPWNGDYHTNINVQMNHWPVESANLSELHLPLVDLTCGLVESGEQSAKAFYGENVQGWVTHMMTNVWKFTAPGFHPSWGATNTGGAWLCAHLWEHYLFTEDRAYLERIYPVIKGASEFFLSTMVVDPKSGWLVTSPTSSPENNFYGSDGVTAVSICMGPTMDTQLVRELFENVVSAATILGCDDLYSKKLIEASEKLPPHKISKDGYLMEWLEDYKEVDIHHRHVSHLYGLHPGNQISVVKTPELAKACKVVLDRRGDEGTGWSRAWKINFWARLGDGDRAYRLFKSLMQPAYTVEEPTKHSSGTFPNLFCSHPPFQMDGNWGGTSGISEMLLQSQDGFIKMLPSLPSSWESGRLRGFRVRGGFTVDLEWSDGVAKRSTITSDRDGTVELKVPNHIESVKVKIGASSQIFRGEEYINLDLKRGASAELRFEE